MSDIRNREGKIIGRVDGTNTLRDGTGKIVAVYHLAENVTSCGVMPNDQPTNGGPSVTRELPLGVAGPPFGEAHCSASPL